MHRIASRLDGDYELVAGALSSHPDVAIQSGHNLGLAEDRIYTSYEEMARAEAARPDGIEAVSIVTPNNVHFGPAKAFLEAGIHVICDKPLTSNLEDARALGKIKPKKGAKFLLTHNYTGFPLVRQARELVKSGALGKLRVVQVEYPQDWLAHPVKSKQANWRTDPAQSGAGGALGDIGTHAYNLARIRHWPQDRLGLRRSHDLRARPQARRQRAHHAALPGRCEGHAVGQPGGGGQRKRPAAARLW